MSPDLHRDSRMIPPNPYGGQQQPPPAQSAPSSVTSQPAPTTNLGRNSISGPQPSTLSRLNTTEFIPNTAPGPNRPPLHPLQHSQPTSIEGSSGPGLFFHHWTPPTASAGGNQPPTPSGKSAQGSPFSQAAASHLRADYQNSPKKRKITGGQPGGTAPTSQPTDPSQPYSSRSSREREMSPGHRNRPRRHSRQSSDESARNHDIGGRTIARPSSRQQRRDELSGVAPDPRRQLTGSSTSASSDDLPVRYEGFKSETR